MQLVAALLLWAAQTSNTTASLRGVSAVNHQVVWASGSGGTWLRTIDGGATWKASHVPDAEKLDFRGIVAIDRRTAWLMSAGSGELSRIYKTSDAGEHWTLQYTNSDPKGFFDSIAFWDASHGIVVGDGVEILTTGDGGSHWERQKAPPALPNEGSFAASNSCIFLRGASEVWFVTGGRVFHSTDRGGAWTVATTPMRKDSASAGIFSIAFSDATHGIVVGGDYAKDKEDRQNIAITSDAGRTWTEPASRPRGFRSAVIYMPDRKLWIVTGTSGSDVSDDGGRTWKAFDDGSYNALSPSGWAVGAKGRIARLQ